MLAAGLQTVRLVTRMTPSDIANRLISLAKLRADVNRSTLLLQIDVDGEDSMCTWPSEAMQAGAR